MERASKYTREIWEDNLNAFLKWGENHKTKMYLIAGSTWLRSFVLNLNYNFTFISNFSAEEDLFEHSIPEIMDALSNEEKVLVFWDESEKCKDDSWIGAKEIKSGKYVSFPFQVFICTNEQVQNMIPEIKCPNFKHNFQNLLNHKDKFNNICSKISVCPVLLVNDNGEIKYEKMRNLVYNVFRGKNTKPIVSKWKIKDWYWKPRIIGNILKCSLNSVYSAIEEGLVSSTINDFRCHDSNRFTNKFYYGIKSDDYFLNNTKDTEILQKLLKLLEINKNSSIKSSWFFIDYYSLVAKSLELRVKSKEFIFSFKKKLFRVKCELPNTDIKGSIYFPHDEDTSVIIEWEVLRCWNLVITIEEDSSFFKLDWYDNVLNPKLSDEFSDLELLDKFSDLEIQDKLGLYIVLKKDDIIGFDYHHLEIIDETWHYQNLEWIGLGPEINKVDKNYFFHILELLPKTIFLELNWTKDSWYLKDELFWTVAFNFKKVMLKYYEIDRNVIIYFNEKEFNKNNVMNSCIKDSRGNWVKIKDISNNFERMYLIKKHG